MVAWRILGKSDGWDKYGHKQSDDGDDDCDSDSDSDDDCDSDIDSDSDSDDDDNDDDDGYVYDNEATVAADNLVDDAAASS